MTTLELLVDICHQIMDFWMGRISAGVHGNHGEGKILDCFSYGRRELDFHDRFAFRALDQDNLETLARRLGDDYSVGHFNLAREEMHGHLFKPCLTKEGMIHGELDWHRSIHFQNHSNSTMK
jgi:hypothetical protein